MSTTEPEPRPRREPHVALRLMQLMAGLVVFGFSLALIVESTLGLPPWDVLHQGLARRTGLSLGTLVVIVSLVVLLAWIPLRQRPGIGTVANALVIGPVLDLGLLVLPTPQTWGMRIAFLLGGVLINGIATGAYIGAELGPGPRDGLMTGLAARGVPIKIGRTVIEVVVLALGWVLGGTVGIGTVLFALALGPLAHVFVPFFSRAAHPRPHPE